MEALRNVFKRLNLVMDGEPAIRFKDAEVLRLLLTEKVGLNLEYTIDSDGDGMLTEAELAALPTLTQRRDGNQSLFTGNTIIETFNEFKYFSGLETINNATFSKCTALREVALPVLSRMGSSVFSESGIEQVIIPEGYQTIGAKILNGATKCRLIDFPSTVTSIGEGLIWAVNNITTVVCRAITPPVFGGWGYNGIPVAIYVPDESVNAYKSATNWSSQSNKIHPLSQYRKL